MFKKCRQNANRCVLQDVFWILPKLSSMTGGGGSGSTKNCGNSVILRGAFSLHRHLQKSTPVVLNVIL